MMADLITINRSTQRTEPALATDWSVSKDGRRFRLNLRRGVAFSDGHPFDADDVVFTFQVYLDEKVNSPQRDLLIIGGKPIEARKAGSHCVEFLLSEPHAAAERLFDSLGILPRHLLEKAWREGRLASAWGMNTPPSQIAGLGPFRLKQYAPGERVVLERNPYYWKTDASGRRLPYLDELQWRFIPSEDTQVLRFLAKEVDLLNRASARNFDLLRQRAAGEQLRDLGAGLDYTFLFFNWMAPEPKRSWFRDEGFRQAVSAVADRQSIVRLVYAGRATPLWGPVSPGNRLWINRSLPSPARSVAAARKQLAASGFRWDGAGHLLDRQGRPVEFSLVTSATNAERVQMASILQADLKELGIHVQVAPLEFRALSERLTATRQFDACIMALGGGDADPNPELSVWLSSGNLHLWNPGQTKPETRWEEEIDGLMRRQMITLDYPGRKRAYDRVQEIIAEHIPFIFLTSPNVLVAGRSTLGNFRPAVMDHSTLWNADELFIRRGTPSR
jgi:peptide/nickel transport system substrate-binding protein